MRKIEKGDLEALKAVPDINLTADEVGQFLGIAPQGIREQARLDPAKLGFPVCVVQRSVYIPKARFIQWYTG